MLRDATRVLTVHDVTATRARKRCLFVGPRARIILIGVGHDKRTIALPMQSSHASPPRPPSTGRLDLG